MGDWEGGRLGSWEIGKLGGWGWLCTMDAPGERDRGFRPPALCIDQLSRLEFVAGAGFGGVHLDHARVDEDVEGIQGPGRGRVHHVAHIIEVGAVAGADELVLVRLPAHRAAQMGAAPVDREKAAIFRPDEEEAPGREFGDAARGKTVDRACGHHPAEFSLQTAGLQKNQARGCDLHHGQRAQRGRAQLEEVAPAHFRAGGSCLGMGMGMGCHG